MTDITEIVPFDPSCKRFAKDMTEYDSYIDLQDNPDLRKPTPKMREDYVRDEEGTYNPENGHFLCDECYIKAGMPSGPRGWKCP